MYSSHTKFLLLLRRCDTQHSLYKTHTHLIVTGFIENQIINSDTIRRYLAFGLPEFALSVHNSSPNPSLSFQNSVIRCFSDHGHHTHLLSLYSQLQNSGSHRSDNYTFPFVIKACAALSDLITGEKVHSLILKTGYSSNLVVQTALVDMYAKIGQMECSTRVFDEISERDLVPWNALISGYASNGLSREALEAFRIMQADGRMRPNASTFVGVVLLKDLITGKSLHGLALKSGVLGVDVLMHKFISMYARLDDLVAARKLFEMVEAKDLVCWNAMVSAYSQNGMPDEAFEVFNLMHCEGVRPDFITMVSVLQSCGDLSSVCCGESVHATGIKVGLTDQVPVVSSLVRMYAKHCELEPARRLFYELRDKNTLLYNSMISAYLLNGIPDMALATFRDMQFDGLIPDALSVSSAVVGCSTTKELNFGKSAHAYGIRRGFDSNIDLMNALLALYLDCGRFDDTIKLFHRMRERNVVSWNTLISGWAKVGDIGACVASFTEMRRQQEIKLDVFTMISIVPSIYRLEDLAIGMSFHGLAIQIGLESDISLQNALITMYTNLGVLNAGYLIFESMSFRRTVISWNAMMTGYRNYGHFKEVMILFDRMKRSNLVPNSVTLLNLLPSCETELEGRCIHAFAIRNLFELEHSLLTSTLCMYARFEDFASCRMLFDMMDKNNVVSWNTMISVYAESKEGLTKAVISFKQMLEMGVAPDAITMLALASACSQLGSLDLAQCVTSFTHNKGFAKNTAVANVLIDMNAKCGSSSFARELFDDLEAKDLITWSTMINAYGMHGNGEAAISLFCNMKEARVDPDGATFVSILSACSHAGYVEQARIVFESMAKEHQIQPRLEHFACMVDLLSRTGHLEEAYEIVRRLVFIDSKSCGGLLESLLGACRSHGDAGVGAAVAELLFELQPGSAGSHVMLSNIYAAAERWTDSGRLRCSMDAKGLKKEPGFSLVEVK